MHIRLLGQLLGYAYNASLSLEFHGRTNQGKALPFLKTLASLPLWITVVKNFCDDPQTLTTNPFR